MNSRTLSVFCLSFVVSLMGFADTELETWWGSQVNKALQRSGDNQAEWKAALERSPEAHRGGLEFLLSNMPDSDLQTLKSERVLETLRLAYDVRQQVAWGDKIPEDIFLNDVLPYCNIDEPRDPWRREFCERFLPLVLACKTPGEAALILNSEVFKQVSVKYSTKRKRANQSPRESIEQGLASCTGLSILLVDACRSCGVPARLAGIAKWPNKNGNHTWVEIWDNGWHFVGAAEPAREGLDHAWFTGDAALAIADSERSSIRAVSFRRTPLRWPLVWAGGSQVSAVNVTNRYAPTRPQQADDSCRLLIRVTSGERQRVAAVVSAVDAGNPTRAWSGNSADESRDTNDILEFKVPRNRDYRVRARLGPAVAECIITIGDEEQFTVDCELPAGPDAVRLEAVRRLALEWFQADPSGRDAILFDPDCAELLRRFPGQVRNAVWQSYSRSGQHADLETDFEKNQIQSGPHLSPYVAKEIGNRPPNGWPMFIAMHGGGGTTQEINDSQWRHMQIYYRDQRQLPGYRYLALRAPDNTWNGFYTDYVYPLIHRLIVQQVLFADVDPDRVFLMGYSHGGYGAFAIGPKMPDHFAAIHSSAAAPTDGETVPETLRNTRFTFMIGENDKRYGRADRCQQFAKAIKSLRGDRSDIFPVTMEWKEGFGHGGLPDRNKIADMYGHVRNVYPRSLNWRMSDSVIRDFFWISCDHPQKEHRVDAAIDNNRVDVQLTGVNAVTLWLDERLVDLEKPVVLAVQAGDQWQNVELTLQPRMELLCQSMLRRGDRERSCSAGVQIEVAKNGISVRVAGQDLKARSQGEEKVGDEATGKRQES